MSLDLAAAPTSARAIARAREIVTTSLDAMASGGMYDHIGGGFARYSVDREWLVPHFEKMLYDQALLVRVYAHAAVALDEPRSAPGRGRDRRATCCATCASPPAGSRRPRTPTRPAPTGTATRACSTRGPSTRSRAVLGADADAALATTGSPPRATSRAARSPTASTPAASSARPPAIEDARRRLFEAREQRPRPGLDDKVLTEWNALMVAALAEAGVAARRADWIDAAVAPADFLLRELRRPGRALVPLVARRRRSRRPATTRSPPTTPPRRRLHPPRRGDRRGPLDRRGDGRRRHPARPLLGRRPRRPVHDARRRRGARRPPEGPLRQRHAVGQLDGRRRPLPPRRAHR